jgi:hypothetical protein|eukprot:4179017-Prymnesium_polylepis.2
MHLKDVEVALMLPDGSPPASALASPPWTATDGSVKSVPGAEEFGEDFGQHEPLTTRLRNILEDYDGLSALLKEMVQNAEDAKARCLIVEFDRTEYSASRLLDDRMAWFQGPAIYVYNDAEFTEQDFRRLCQLGDSSKSLDTSVIGNFGLGFNTVYALTDLPSILSGKYVAFLDPHASFVPGAKPHAPGRRYNFVDTPVAKVYPEQFEPFLKFGCDLTQPFPGTIFRFPIRHALAAKHSKIVDKNVSPDTAVCKRSTPHARPKLATPTRCTRLKQPLSCASTPVARPTSLWTTYHTASVWCILHRCDS